MGLFKTLRLSGTVVDSQDEVTPRMKPEAVVCPCSDVNCNVMGRPLTKMSRDGLYHVVRCRCISHRNGRNRKNGLTAQRKAARAIGVPASNGFLPANEEQFGGAVRMESKSGAIVRPMFTAFWKAWLQSDQARALGDMRPIVVMAKERPNGNDGIVAFRISDLEAVVYALAQNMGMFDE